MTAGSRGDGPSGAAASSPRRDLARLSETAAWVAGYRASESRRPDRLFNDPYAHLFASATHEQAADGTDLASGVLVQRTVVFDEIIAQLVADEAIDLVVNLAAGYDARPYRLDLPAALEWVEVDLPQVLERKRAVLGDAKPGCRLRSIALDLSRPSERERALSRLAKAAGRALVITEGILLYLEEAEAVDLAAALHRQPSFEFWLTDLMSPGARQRMNVFAQTILASFGTTLRFSPETGADFFRAAGWEPVIARRTMLEMIRLGRGPDPELLKRLVQLGATNPNPAAPGAGLDGTVLFRRTAAAAS